LLQSIQKDTLKDENKVAVSGIEFRWAEGFEDRSDRDHMRGIVCDAFEIAAEGLARIGLDAVPRPRVVMHTAGPHERIAGEAMSSRTMHLYITAGKLAARRISAPTLSDTVFHEQVHCLRMDTIPLTGNLPEFAVTEGLAYVAENGYKNWRYRNYGGIAPKAIGIVEKVKMLPDQQILELRRGLIDVALAAKNSDTAWQHWHFRAFRNLRAGRNVVVGVDSVLRQQRVGRSIADLLLKSPAEILGLE
jgi:hypothetical protein